MLRKACLLLAIAVSLLQVHFCGPTFLMSDGSLCPTCPTLVDNTVNHEARKQIAEQRHGDCHDCCKLTECKDNDGKQPVTSASSQHFDYLALAQLPNQLVLPDIEFAGCAPPFEPGRPATGPPSERPARAPPVHIQSTSAGCADLIV